MKKNLLLILTIVGVTCLITYLGSEKQLTTKAPAQQAASTVAAPTPGATPSPASATTEPKPIVPDKQQAAQDAKKASAIAAATLNEPRQIRPMRPALPTDIPTPFTPVEKSSPGQAQRTLATGMMVRFPGSVLLHERSSVQLTGEIKRERLIRTTMKNPLVRIEEILTPVKDGTEQTIEREVAMVADHVIIQPKKDIAEADFLKAIAKAGGEVRRKYPLSGNYLVSFKEPNLDTVSQAVAKLSGNTTGFVEPDFIVFASVLPNDTDFTQLWGMHNTGQSGGLADADIDAVEAWDKHTGSDTVIVGIIDSGVDHTHPDLSANMWTNAAESAGTSGVDDDGNGYIDDIRGWDFANDDNDPMDDNDHGTHCAGTIGGTGNNTRGVVGVCWDVSLVGLKFLAASGSGATSDAVEATAYATRMNFTMTSNSWGGGGYSTAMFNTITAANVAGIPFIAAAGNSATDNDSVPHYPASYVVPNVLSIASTTRLDQLSGFSCFGATSVDLAAPGSEILSTVPNGLYSSFNGTSMATPHVSGAMALLKSYKPALTGPELIELITQSVDVLPVLAGRMVTGGRLNVNRAIIDANSVTVSGGDLFALGNAGGPFSPATKVYTLRNRTAAPATWSVAANATWVTLSPSGGTLAPGASVTVTVGLSASVGGFAEGSYASVVTFRNVTGSTSVTRNARVQVGYRDYFTEQFAGGRLNDLDFSSILFTPAASRNRYTAARSIIAAFPTDPTGGTSVPASEDGSHLVTLTTPVYVHGVPYSRAYIGSNGYLTFTSASTDYLETPGAHFQMPRVSALFDDLSPLTPGQMSYKQLTDRFVVTWQAVPQYSGSDSNSFQIEMFHDGRIRISYLGIAATDGIAGLSDGAGAGPDFLSSDLTGYAPNLGSIQSPPTVAETAGVLTGQGRVTLAQPATSPIVFTLASELPGRLTVPASVGIGAGGTSATFDITIIDDAGLNGSSPITITATSSLGSFSSVTVVNDNETTALTVAAPVSATEGDTGIIGSVTMGAPALADTAISLISADTSEIKLPVSVTIPAGASSANFAIVVEDDDELDGSETVTLTASVPGWTSGSDEMVVHNNDTPTLALSLATSPVAEGIGSVTGTVTLGGRLASNVNISLTSSDPRVTLPSTVTVNSGSIRTTFPISITNDSVIAADFSSTLGASASGFSAASVVVNVQDDDPATLFFSALPDQLDGVPFTITVTALDGGGSPKTNYTGQAAITATLDGSPEPITPVSGQFVNGVCSLPVTLSDLGVARITVTSEGRSIQSNSFNVLDSTPDYYTEQFFGFGDDLDNQSFTFVPFGNGYRVRRDIITALPVPGFATHSRTGVADDTFVQKTLSAGRTVKLFGVSYSSYFINSNGNITFGAGDTIYSESLSRHFTYPRVSAVFDDLHPGYTGHVVYTELSDRLVVTWGKVPTYATVFAARTLYVTAQIEMFYNGTIRISHMDVPTDSYIIGLSRGGGYPLGFFESDFSSYPSQNLTLDIDAFGAEGAGTSHLGVIDIGHLTGGSVALAPLSAGDLTLPTTLTIPVGRRTANFNFSVVDDASIETTEPVQVRATLLGRTATDTITIDDNDFGNLTVEAPTAVSEGGAPFLMKILCNGAPARPVVLNLSSSDPTVVSVPATVTLPAGARSVSVSARILEDSVDNRTRNVTLSASYPTWTSGSRVVLVGDNDPSRILVDTLPPVSEAVGGAVPVTLRITSRTGGVTRLSLTSSHPALVAVPAFVDIPADESFVTINAQVFDNSDITGNTAVTLTVTAPSHVDGVAPLQVLDNDASTLTFSAIGANQRAGMGIPLTIRAADGQGRTLTGLNGPVSLTASNTGGPVAITTSTTPTFVNGVANTVVTVTAVATGVTLNATFGAGSGVSSSFDVTAAAPDYVTENFTPPEVVDIQNTSFTFYPQPGASSGFEYRVERTSITALPSAATGGTTLSLGNDLSLPVSLTGGQQVLLFGVPYSTVYVGANGHISTVSDISSGSTPAFHFAAPRISLLMANLRSGTSNYRQLADRLVVTWNAFLGDSPANNTNTFQAELFFDGRIRLSYLKINQNTFIMGLSNGGGSPVAFTESDFSTYPVRAVITKQPVSLAVLHGAAAAEFTVAAQGAAVTYQWRKDGANITGATSEKLRISPVQGSHRGVYDVVVSTVDRQEVSLPATLTVTELTSFNVNPISHVIADGAPLLLTGGVTNPAGVTWQWLKNNAVIVGATTPVYSLSAAQQTHAGSYSLRAKNAAGTVTSSVAIIGVLKVSTETVVQNVDKPLTLTAPAAGTGLTYQWEKDGVTMANDTRISGVTTAKLTIKNFNDPDTAAYTCVVTAGSRFLESGAFNVRVRHIPTIDAFAPGPWIVSGTVNETFTASREPVTYKVTGLPAGVTQVPNQNRLIGKPTVAGNFTLLISATNLAGTTTPPVAVPVQVLAADTVAPVVGNFEGLLLPNAPGSATNLNGGTLRFSVAATGNVTGTVLLDGISTAVTSRIDTTVAGLPTVTLVKTTAPAFTWTGTFGADGHFTGTLTRGLEVSIVDAWKTGLSAPTAYAGLFNTALEPESAVVGNLAFPQGVGHIAFTIVGTTGAVSWKGKLADGTIITGSSKLGPTLKVPVHHQLYGATTSAGGVNGWLQLSTDGIGQRITSSNLKWRKPYQVTATRSYRTGFAQHIVDLSGRPYLAANPVLTLGATSPNARISFSSAKIDLSSFTSSSGGILHQDLSLTQPALVVTAVGNNVANVKVTVVPATGAVSGSFTIVDSNPLIPAQVVSRAVTFTGLLVEGTHSALGNFQLAELPSNSVLPATTPTTSPILSGKVQLLSVP